ncbi:hypothetical protein EBZ80_11285 [bacterium]|nr:hypothetical protein [bacterium]
MVAGTDGLAAGVGDGLAIRVEDGQMLDLAGALRGGKGLRDAVGVVPLQVLLNGWFGRQGMQTVAHAGDGRLDGLRGKEFHSGGFLTKRVQGHSDLACRQ